MSREEDVRGGKRRGPWILGAAALAVGVVAWGAVVAANRHQISPPTRDAPVHEEEAFEHGLSPQDLRQFLADGVSSCTVPNGARVVLTLHPQLQQDVFDLFRRFDPPYGVFAAMEPKTGRVVALVGYRKGGESDPWLPLKAIYPAASLIKVVTAAAALEKGAVSPEDEISYRGGIYRITKKSIHAKDGRGVPTMSLEEAIARSANTVFGKVAVEEVGSEGLREYMEKFGFGQKIPFGLPVEVSQGEVPTDEYNLARTGAGFGEVYVSPLHMAMIMSAIGNSGEMPRPVIIERVEEDGGGILYEAEPSKWRDTVTPQTADTLLKMMVKTIEMGTSRRAFGSPESTPLLQDIQVAGKTGSLSGWSPRMRFEWFAGVAPVGDAKLAVAALVVNNNHWKIKGSYVGKEAFSAYFGYPQSNPPVYRKAKGKAKVRRAGRKTPGSRARVPKAGRKGKRVPEADGAAKPPARIGRTPGENAPTAPPLAYRRPPAGLPGRG